MAAAWAEPNRSRNGHEELGFKWLRIGKEAARVGLPAFHSDPLPRCIVANTVQIGFTMEHQEQFYWCWAAVSSSVARFFNGPVHASQCEVANMTLNCSSCCANGGSAVCNVTSRLPASLALVKHLESWGMKKVASFSRVRDEIDASRPLCLRIAYLNGSGAHFLAIVGYVPANAPGQNTPDVLVGDPLHGEKQVPYDRLVSGYYDAAWTDTYYIKA